MSGRSSERKSPSGGTFSRFVTPMRVGAALWKGPRFRCPTVPVRSGRGEFSCRFGTRTPPYRFRPKSGRRGVSTPSHGSPPAADGSRPLACDIRGERRHLLPCSRVPGAKRPLDLPTPTRDPGPDRVSRPPVPARLLGVRADGRVTGFRDPRRGDAYRGRVSPLSFGGAGVGSGMDGAFPVHDRLFAFVDILPVVSPLLRRLFFPDRRFRGESPERPPFFASSRESGGGGGEGRRRGLDGGPGGAAGL